LGRFTLVLDANRKKRGLFCVLAGCGLWGFAVRVSTHDELSVLTGIKKIPIIILGIE
jgi:hypothetical protein